MVYGWEDPLEESMASHSSILAWRILWTEEIGGLQSMGHKDSDTTEWLSTHAVSFPGFLFSTSLYQREWSVQFLYSLPTITSICQKDSRPCGAVSGLWWWCPEICECGQIALICSFLSCFFSSPLKPFLCSGYPWSRALKKFENRYQKCR